MSACHSDPAVAGEESPTIFLAVATDKARDVGKPGLMFRISLRRFAPHDKWFTNPVVSPQNQALCREKIP
jgi:hypothetical protein